MDENGSAGCGCCEETPTLKEEPAPETEPEGDGIAPEPMDDLLLLLLPPPALLVLPAE